MYDRLLFISEIILAIETAIFSLCFLFLSVPKIEALRNYRACRRYIAFAYLILALLNTFDLIIDTGPNYDLYTSVYITLIVSSFQASLVTYALVTLINLNYVKPKTFITGMLPPSLFSLWFVIVTLIIHSQKILEISGYVFEAFYALQIIYYTWQFLKQSHLYKEKLNNYFSEQESKRAQWIQVAFFTALSIGIMALLAQVFPTKLSAMIFNISCTVFYFYFAVNYLNYLYIFHFIKPIATPEIQETEKGTLPLSRGNLAEALDQWEKRKGFTLPGITISDVASDLNTNRTYLSTYINNHKEMNFSEWVNQLRIEEAKALLSKQPDLPIVEISETVGYSHLSNFGRQFSKITGTTPVSWRKNLQNN
ncbi:MAG: AraC family transcriptional regulator [Bacteroidota bacterium]|nr:AraC family transcriptional regulator [Bacteroidota bacterium]